MNDYLIFSEAIRDLTAAEAKWCAAKLQEIRDTETPETLADWQIEMYDQGYLGFEWLPRFSEKDGRFFWIYAEENGNIENAVTFLQAFLREFRPDGYFTLEYACYSDKPRIQSSCGGAVFITANPETTEWLDTRSWLAEQAARFQKSAQACANLTN